MPPHPKVYDPLAGPLMTAFHFRGTVVPKVIHHPGFWIFTGINLLVFILFNTDYISELHLHRFKMDSDGLKAVAGITTFFEVFYTNACYDRFKRFWGLNKAMCQKIYDFVMTVQVITKPTGKPYAQLAARWLAVLHMAATSREQRKDTVWQKLTKLDYVTEEEAKLLKDLKDCQRVLLLCRASSELAKAGIEEAKAPLNILSVPLKHLLCYADLAEEVEDLMLLPIPYQYFHLLNFMITFYLSMSAYSLGLTRSFWAPVFFLIQTLIYMGMLELASQLADPFGDDDADFPLHYWGKDFLDNLSVLVFRDMVGSSTNFKDQLEQEGKNKTRFSLTLGEVETILFGSTSAASGSESRNGTSASCSCCSKAGGRGDQEHTHESQQEQPSAPPNGDPLSQPILKRRGIVTSARRAMATLMRHCTRRRQRRDPERSPP